MFLGDIVGVIGPFVKEEFQGRFSADQILHGRHQAGDIVPVVVTLDGQAPNAPWLS
jgi:hypothetical protein